MQEEAGEVKTKKMPQVLTIAGSDSGGGAGIQADLKTFQERFVFGTSVLTAVTAQNTLGVHKIEMLPKEIISAQLAAIQSDFSIQAVKTGMLGNQEVIALVASALATSNFGSLVVDPVMIAKGGATLLEPTAVTALRALLLPLATVVTPNLPEAELLVEEKLTSPEAVIKAAKTIQKAGAQNVVIKGGHSEDLQQAKDLLLVADGSYHWFEKPRIATANTHGTGCTFSAVITAELAKGRSVKQSVEKAKEYIHAAISQPVAIGHGHGPVNHWAFREVDRHDA